MTFRCLSKTIVKGKKTFCLPFYSKRERKFLSFGLFSLLLWFLCCHELTFWRVINLKYSTKSLQISSKHFKRSLYCRSSLFVFQVQVGSPVSRACLKKAVNRWFLAVTLQRNPSLVKFRRQGRHLTASVVTLGSVNFNLTFQCKTLRLTQQKEYCSLDVVLFAGDLL